MKLLVINGPNLNLLGVREPKIYGKKDYNSLCTFINDEAKKLGISVEIYQSNHEGDIIDKIQHALKDYDGIVINPAAFSHTSIAILDALKAVNLPIVEVHLTDIFSRESFRKHSVTGEAALKIIYGRGFDGYAMAMKYLRER